MKQGWQKRQNVGFVMSNSLEKKTEKLVLHTYEAMLEAVRLQGDSGQPKP